MRNVSRRQHNPKVNAGKRIDLVEYFIRIPIIGSKTNVNNEVLIMGNAFWFAWEPTVISFLQDRITPFLKTVFEAVTFSAMYMP